jgi:hypothetical protein
MSSWCGSTWAHGVTSALGAVRWFRPGSPQPSPASPASHLLHGFPSADDSQGSIGFILNRPSALRLAEVAVSAKGDVAAVADVFGGQRLRVGGPVHLDTLTVLHGYAGCQGAQKVSEVRGAAGRGGGLQPPSSRTWTLQTAPAPSLSERRACLLKLASRSLKFWLVNRSLPSLAPPPPPLPSPVGRVLWWTARRGRHGAQRPGQPL